MRRSRAGALLSLLTLGALATVAAGLTLSFKHAGERAIEGRLALRGMVAELRLQDGLEWRAISGRVAAGTVAPELLESAGRARALGADAVRYGLPAGRGVRLASLHEAYLGALTEELALLTAGDDAEAEEIDETEVDPRFDAVIDELDEQTQWLRRRAAEAQRAGDAGVLATVIASLGAAALIQRRRVRADIQRREEQRLGARYRALVDRSADLVMVLGADRRMRYLSPAAERFIRDDLALDPLGADLSDLVHPDDRDAVLAALPQPDATAPARLGREGRWRHFELSIQDLTQEPSVGGTVLTAHDVTERQALQKEMLHQATHDALTGLPNRALLGTRLDHCLRAEHGGPATGLLLIDLDRFKEINDTLGHHVGDEVLHQVGPRLTGALRETDTVARLGGDEFAVLLPGAGTVRDAVAVAESLRATLKAPFQLDQLTLHVEASVGVAVSGVHGRDTPTLFRRADVAMYHAKQTGQGVSVYDPAVDGNSPQRLALLADLRRGLDDDELVLHYQPQAALADGTIRGAEALVRWQHPTRGLLAPDAFIPAAEHSGLIGPLTTRVLNLALARARRWLTDGHPLQISVNLSARSLLDDNLDREVAELLDAHQVPAELLTLEITESAVMVEPAFAAQILHRLRGRGIQISIDDFGAGYTSLAHLKDLPVDELKIDRSFVMAMADDRSSRLIVHSVVDLGHNLGLRTVAEGVETAEALSTLAGYGCDIAQGYHLSRPIPGDEFDRWRATPALR
ncbi:EAL domain-containing protein [Actinoplanes sp. TBRC 11911]|uniref:putative bifunctional diguanylate cyclase/phosphodiesterase n=1 Tax=Actinoplanes sp. TBRC 11911 TaxID=2729386 RepID=UPI00145FC913|nr:EAL domain-containing protein [Actinoplanes sp. TBRC 11911]NMO55229.1 EAL domain-containing protein [Actinoplanes sp. TBRC 11911]